MIYRRKTADGDHSWQFGTLLIYLENASYSMNVIIKI
jgi:hypothetical protein